VPHSDREARIRWAGWILASALAGLSGLFYTSYRRVQENLTNVTGEMQRLTGRAAQSHHLMDALTDPQATRAMLAPRGLARATRKGPTATITYEASKGSLVFLGTNLDPVQLYKTYELWVLPADGSTPIPAGTFHPDEHGNASVIMPVIRTGVRAKAFEVTLEDKGGADKPTPPIILSTN